MEGAGAGGKRVSLTNQIEDIRRVFDTFDTDKNGTLDVEETKQALKTLSGDEENYYAIQPTDDEIQSIIGSVDANKDGCLNFEEFLVLVRQINEIGNEVRQQFDFFDKNGDGFIEKSELKKGLKQLNQKIEKKTIKRMIKDADIDGDGKISFSEFQRILISENSLGS